MAPPNSRPPYQNAANYHQQRFNNAGGPGYAYAGLPMEAYTGYPGDGYTEPAVVPPFMRAPANSETVISDDGFSDPSVLESSQRTDIPCGLDQEPLPNTSCGPWKPAGISKPWPEDEYLFDGGDSDGGVKVRRDGQLEGLDVEDTIAHYDTLAGKTCVTPSCRVCIYAPRFAAVRQVTLAYGENQLVRAGGVDMRPGRQHACPRKREEPHERCQHYRRACGRDSDRPNSRRIDRRGRRVQVRSVRRTYVRRQPVYAATQAYAVGRRARRTGLHRPRAAGACARRRAGAWRCRRWSCWG
jgi:hypothetical protein